MTRNPKPEDKRENNRTLGTLMDAPGQALGSSVERDRYSRTYSDTYLAS